MHHRKFLEQERDVGSSDIVLLLRVAKREDYWEMNFHMPEHEKDRKQRLQFALLGLQVSLKRGFVVRDPTLNGVPST